MSYVTDNYDRWKEHDRIIEEREERSKLIGSVLDDIEKVILLLDQDEDVKEQAQDELRKIMDRLEAGR